MWEVLWEVWKPIVGSLEKPKSCHSLVCDSRYLVPHTKYLLNLFDDIHYTAIFNPLIIVYVCSIFIIIRTDFRHIKHVFCHKKYSPKVSLRRASPSKNFQKYLAEMRAYP